MAKGRLEGKVCVVTGGSTGIGHGTARRFLSEGATVIFNARTAVAGERAEAALREVATTGTVHFVQADIGIKEQIEAVVDRAVKDHGRIDALVNNAQGIPPTGPIMGKPDADYRYSIEAGLMGTKWAMQRAFPAMRDQGGGSIVNTSSGWAHLCPPNVSDYAANKSALEAFTRCAASEWGPYNINVNIVVPFSRSAGWDNFAAANRAFAEKIEGDQILGRIGDPEFDLGSLALGLVTEEARFITGQIFNGDGGQKTLRHDYTATDNLDNVDFQAKH